MIVVTPEEEVLQQTERDAGVAVPAGLTGPPRTVL
jgi:hypothetical protein